MNRKKAGFILIITGLLLFLGLFGAVVINDYYHWYNNLDGFQYKYETFAYMLYTREKGAFLFSIAAGLLPVSLGFILYRKK